MLSGLLRKVRLLTVAGELVTEAYSLPYQHWPQAFLWGQRVFVRRDFQSDPAHTTADPPDYYEAVALMAYSQEDLVELGVV